MKKKLGIINSSPYSTSYGGIGPFIKNLDPFLKKNFDITYITLNDKLDKIELFPKRLIFLIFLVLNIKLIRKQDCILSHAPEGSFVVTLTDVPLLHIFHGNYNPMSGSRYWYGKSFRKLFDFFEKRIFKYAKKMYTVGDEREGVFKILNPINHCVINKAKRSGFIFAGRLELMKNIDRIINIYSKLPKEIQSTNLLFIAGIGSQTSNLKTLVQKLSLTESVVFLGNLSNVQLIEEVSSKSILLMASSYEGLPMAIAEALSVGVPVISTDIGDISRVLKWDYNGFILPLDYKDETYIDCISKILLNYGKFSNNALLSSEIFSAEKVSQDLTTDILEIFND